MASSRLRADEVSLFPDRTPRRVTKDRDRRSVEVGTPFRTSVAGSVTGVRVYKIARAKGATPRRASLWSAAANDSPRPASPRTRGSGWVGVRFDAPVAVRARAGPTRSRSRAQGPLRGHQGWLAQGADHRGLSTGGDRTASSATARSRSSRPDLAQGQLLGRRDLRRRRRKSADPPHDRRRPVQQRVARRDQHRRARRHRTDPVLRPDDRSPRPAR